jgi:hypothetical protein
MQEQLMKNSYEPRIGGFQGVLQVMGKMQQNYALHYVL